MKRIQAMMVGVGLALLTATAAAADFNVTTPAEFQTALTTAEANGEADTINVAAGTYNLAATLTYATTENHGLAIVGAGAATTILDGGNAVPVMRLSGEGNGDIHVSGMTMEHGRMANAGGFGGGLFILNSAAGAITVDQCIVTDSTSVMNAGGAWLGAVNGDITVTDSEFTHNACDAGTSDDGCGLYLYFDGDTAVGNATVRGNLISHNVLNDNPNPIGGCDGAGMMIYHLGSGAFAMTVEDNVISDNASIHGVAGIVVRNPHVGATITIAGNTFSGNIAGGTPHVPHPEIPGGAAHIYSDGGTMVIRDNVFLDNESRGPYDRGAGLCIDNFPSGSFQMLGNAFVGNTCASHGGGAQINLGNGVTDAVIAGNLFVNNQAGAGASDGSGGGLSLNSAADVTVANNTFYGNIADDGGGMSYYAESAADVATMANCIFRNDAPNAISVFSLGPVQATYSNIEGGGGEPWFGTGCIDADPLFFNVALPAGADGLYGTTDDGLHLTAASPSSNTGSNAAVPAALVLDLAGQARIQGAAVDMGAYEGAATTPVPHWLTMVCDPVAGGATVPAAGPHSLTSPQAIAATPADGYYFDQWTAEPVDVAIAAPTSASTTVGFATDCTITAHFVEIPATATLTVAVSPAEGGTTSPAAGVHPDQPTETPIAIVATPAEGYGFVNWTATRHLTIGNAASPTTTVTMVADGTVTANFARLPHRFTVTLGSQITLEAEHVGEDATGNPFGDIQFQRKPKVFGTYYDPVKDPARERPKKASVKITFDRNTPASARGTWTKKICLLNKRAILPGQDAETYLPANQVDALVMENLWVAVANAEGNVGPFDGGELTLVPPTIAGVYPDDTFAVGTEIAAAAAGDVIFLQGNYFGTKPPKVWLEHVVVKAGGDVVKAKSCKIRKPLLFPDAKNNPGRSCMDLDDADGLSRIAVQLPTSWPNGWDHGAAHNLVIDNGIGRATTPFGTAP
jgi:hypothetical protein